MIQLHKIPSDHYIPALKLVKEGANYIELKAASKKGGVLHRYQSKKTRRVYYKAKNLRLL